MKLHLVRYASMLLPAYRSACLGQARTYIYTYVVILNESLGGAWRVMACLSIGWWTGGGRVVDGWWMGGGWEVVHTAACNS
jgi:hypothetical protein